MVAEEKVLLFRRHEPALGNGCGPRLGLGLGGATVPAGSAELARLGRLGNGLSSSAAGTEPAPAGVEVAALVAKVETLERGLLSRTVIGQAQGILVERHKITVEAAFGMLVHASTTTNRKLYDIAAELVLTGELQGSAADPARGRPAGSIPGLTSTPCQGL